MRFGVPTRQVSSAALFALAVASALGGTGCAHADSVADRHIEEMHDAIGKIQTEQDRTNQRLGLLEVAAEERKEARAKDTAKPAAPRPVRTVQIGDADEPLENDDPNDPNARPEIRLQGQAGAGSRPVRGKTATRGSREARLEPTDDPKGDSPRPSALDPAAKKSYEAAVGLVHAKQYDRALEALAAFLVRWPDHPYAENATYWRGECYFARGEFLRAAEQFEAVLARFNGNKAPDALLKIGMCHDRLGSSDRAKEYWDRLRRDYPRSDAAKKAPGNSASDTRGSGPKESR